MVELQDFNEYLMQLSGLPTPYNFPYHIYGSKAFTVAGSYDVTFTVPATTDIYHLTNVTVIANILSYQIAKVYSNDSLIYYEYSKKPINWILGKERAISFFTGDTLKLTVTHIGATARTHHWCISFWRESGVSEA
jgi:hypothetical protein